MFYYRPVPPEEHSPGIRRAMAEQVQMKKSQPFALTELQQTLVRRQTAVL